MGGGEGFGDGADGGVQMATPDDGTASGADSTTASGTPNTYIGHMHVSAGSNECTKNGHFPSLSSFMQCRLNVHLLITCITSCTGITCTNW